MAGFGFVFLSLLLFGGPNARAAGQNRIVESFRLKIQTLRKFFSPPIHLQSESGNENLEEHNDIAPTPDNRAMLSSLFGDDKFQRIDSKEERFMMGSPIGEGERHGDEGRWNGGPVEAGFTYSFEIMKTEVTQEQWFAVMEGPPFFAGNISLENPSYFSRKEYCEEDHKVITTIRGSKVGMCPHHPVEHVSRDMAQEFVDRLNDKLRLAGCDRAPQEAVGCYRLPTEAEWEFAARGGTNSVYSFGDDSLELDGYGWYWNNSKGSTHRVGLKTANPFGLFDMHGNVHEWVMDLYSELPGGDNPLSQTGIYHIARGGSWANLPGDLRSARRHVDYPQRPEYYLYVFGLRLVKTL